MRIHPIRAFRDPVTRPRAIVWTAMLVVAFLLVWAAGLIGTSNYWFCTTPCHMVHDDNTLAYDASSHAKVSCIACHEPLNANPLEFTVMKIYVLPDLVATVMGTYEIPVNGASHVAMETPDELCTQCHNLKNRTITPSAGVVIDHAVHTDAKVSCTTCHNRVAHKEDDIELVLGERKHDDWMTMDACFRCHGTASEPDAPRDCKACHTEKFDLVPASHDATGWYHLYGESGGHAKAAKAESESIEAAREINTEYEEVEADKTHGPVAELAPSSEINSCYTCHEPTFCTGCHQMQIPHPAEFKKSHAQAGYATPATCATCHARSAAEAKATGFCNACHHSAGDASMPWLPQHSAAVRKDGADPCFECHKETQCSYCHVNGTPAGRAALQSEYRK